jgi:hypothetical protein
MSSANRASLPRWSRYHLNSRSRDLSTSSRARGLPEDVSGSTRIAKSLSSAFLANIRGACIALFRLPDREFTFFNNHSMSLRACGLQSRFVIDASALLSMSRCVRSLVVECHTAEANSRSDDMSWSKSHSASCNRFHSNTIQPNSRASGRNTCCMMRHRCAGVSGFGGGSSSTALIQPGPFPNGTSETSKTRTRAF